jgi:NADH:ubiquinone oxidoreductase subunit 6 (subunit J)
MMRNLIFWLIAVIVTLAAARYQRATGPTHPARGEFNIGQETYRYKLIRSHGGESDAPITLTIPDSEVTGFLIYKRYNVDEEWTTVPMQRDGDELKAFLPHQPPAGKLEYFIRLQKGDEAVIVPRDRDLVIRFKGAVPITVLLPHILLMFSAMLVSTRAGLEALTRNGNPRKYVLWATGLLFFGGMIMGPIVQKYAFGAFWTGAPFGWDLTDNKTLIAMIGWVIALIATGKGRRARWSVIGAAVLLLLVFSIPHSMMGSELDYQTGEVVSSGVGE